MEGQPPNSTNQLDLGAVCVPVKVQRFYVEAMLTDIKSKEYNSAAVRAHDILRLQKTSNQKFYSYVVDLANNILQILDREGSKTAAFIQELEVYAENHPCPKDHVPVQVDGNCPEGSHKFTVYRDQKEYTCCLRLRTELLALDAKIDQNAMNFEDKNLQEEYKRRFKLAKNAQDIETRNQVFRDDLAPVLQSSVEAINKIQEPEVKRNIEAVLNKTDEPLAVVGVSEKLWQAMNAVITKTYGIGLSLQQKVDLLYNFFFRDDVAIYWFIIYATRIILTTVCLINYILNKVGLWENAKKYILDTLGIGFSFLGRTLGYILMVFITGDAFAFSTFQDPGVLLQTAFVTGLFTFLPLFLYGYLLKYLKRPAFLYDVAVTLIDAGVMLSTFGTEIFAGKALSAVVTKVGSEYCDRNVYSFLAIASSLGAGLVANVFVFICQKLSFPGYLQKAICTNLIPSLLAMMSQFRGVPLTPEMTRDAPGWTFTDWMTNFFTATSGAPNTYFHSVVPKQPQGGPRGLGM